MDCMLDLETLSTRPNAVILVIAAIKFNRNNKEEKIDREYFYTRIKIDSCLEVGCIIEDETVEWWNKQDEKIRYESLENPDRITLKEALEKFSEWYGNCTYIWGNGSSFDCTILNESFKRCKIQTPWKYYNERDLRTIMDIGKVYSNQLPQNEKHNAIFDCYRQIIGLKMSLKNLHL